MHDKTDEEIAILVQNGDAEAFGEILKRYEPKLLRYGKKFLFDYEDSRDLVQDSFIKAYVNIQSYDARRKFSSWMYRIAHNEFINALKKKTRMPFLTFDLDAVLPHLTSKETADGELQRQEMQQMLDAGLSRIDAKYREPLVLYYFEDMDYREIADVLKLPVSTVGIRLRRGKKMLQKQLNQPS